MKGLYEFRESSRPTPCIGICGDILGFGYVFGHEMIEFRGRGYTRARPLQ
jgi:hypothetical protein